VATSEGGRGACGSRQMCESQIEWQQLSLAVAAQTWIFILVCLSLKGKHPPTLHVKPVSMYNSIQHIDNEVYCEGWTL
jgi:hypothetical protein